MTKYLERYGGYRDQRTFGLLQWQLAQAFDLLGSNQTEGAKDVLALAIVMIDQLVSDSGRADLGWILTLQEDPPSTVFSSPQHSSGSVRVCSHLADPKWVAVALSYVKEMGTLASRRAEVPRSQPSGPASVEAPATPAKSEAAKSETVGRAQSGRCPAEELGRGPVDTSLAELPF